MGWALPPPTISGRRQPISAWANPPCWPDSSSPPGVPTPIATRKLLWRVGGWCWNVWSVLVGSASRTPRKRTKRRCFSNRAALPRFAAVATVGAAINTVIVGSLFAAGLHYLVAQVAATAIVLAWNFLANKYWTFGA